MPSLAYTEQLRIGSVTDPDYGFSRINEVDVDADGQIYVFENQALEIRVYSPTGDLVRRIGRPGQGPGEFMGPRFSFGVRADSVWVIEPFARRITIFDRMGDVLSVGTIATVRIPWERPGESAALIPFEMEPEGLFVSELGSIPRFGVGPRVNDAPEPKVEVPAIEPTPVLRVPRVRFDATGQLVDTVGWGTNVTAGSEERLLAVQLADGELHVRYPAGQGPASGRLEMFRIDLRGDTAAFRRFRFRPAKTADGEWHKPVTMSWAGNDGAVWLRRGVSPEGAYRWLILDRTLAPIGQIDVPSERFRVEWSSGDAFIAVVGDEMGVPWIVKYALGPG